MRIASACVYPQRFKMNFKLQIVTACVLLVASSTLCQGDSIRMKRWDLNDWMKRLLNLGGEVNALLEKVKELPQVVIKTVESACSMSKNNCKVFGQVLDAFVNYPATVIEKTVEVCAKNAEVCLFMSSQAKAFGSLPATVLSSALDFCGSTPTACLLKIKGLLERGAPAGGYTESPGALTLLPVPRATSSLNPAPAATPAKPRSASDSSNGTGTDTRSRTPTNQARAQTAMGMSPWFHVVTLIILIKIYLRF